MLSGPRAVLARLEAAGAAADDPPVEGAASDLAAGWGPALHALDAAAQALAHSLEASAHGYEATDATAMGGGG